MSHKLVSLYIGDGEYYTRTDADNVISDLEESHKKEVGQLLIEIAELKKEKEYVIEHTAEVINGQESELRELKARIAELEEECRWRKFPDEKPTEDIKFLVINQLILFQKTSFYRNLALFRTITNFIH